MLCAMMAQSMPLSSRAYRRSGRYRILEIVIPARLVPQNLSSANSCWALRRPSQRFSPVQLGRLPAPCAFSQRHARPRR